MNMPTKATECLVSLCDKKLIKAFPTRWRSTFLVIERLLQVKATVLQELEWDNLPTSDCKHLENIHRLLKPFTIHLSYKWRGVQHALINYPSCDGVITAHAEGTRQAVSVLLVNLKQRFRTFMDPSDPDHLPLYLTAT